MKWCSFLAICCVSMLSCNSDDTIIMQGSSTWLDRKLILQSSGRLSPSASSTALKSGLSDACKLLLGIPHVTKIDADSEILCFATSPEALTAIIDVSQGIAILDSAVNFKVKITDTCTSFIGWPAKRFEQSLLSLQRSDDRL